MDTNEIKIRPATEADAAEILNIYAPYITDTAITFEYDVPTLEEFTGRIRHTLEKYPYLVAVRDSEIIGYAYAGAFYGRAAYDWYDLCKEGLQSQWCWKTALSGT